MYFALLSVINGNFTHQVSHKLINWNVRN